LWKDAAEYIQKEFQEINVSKSPTFSPSNGLVDTLTSDKFLGLTVEGIKTILSVR
jgi:hypothetical protein